MNEPIKAEEFTISEGRTSQHIASEIIAIREQTRTTLQAIAASAAIEIGKRLKEAKSLVPYGSWGDWLKDNLDYSDRTAQNLMRLADESEKAGFGPLLDLSYTQAVQLIGLPTVDREAFMETNDVTAMSVRELKEAIKEYATKVAGMQLKIDTLENEITEMQDEDGTADGISDAMRETEAAKQAAEKAKAEVARLQNEAKESRKTIEKLNVDLKAAEQVKLKETQALAQARAAVPEAVQKELESLRENERRRKAASEDAQAAMKREGAEYTFRALYDQMRNDFERLTAALQQMEGETKGRYREAVLKALDAMKEKTANER